MEVQNNISFCSYNIKHYDDTKKDGIRELLEKCTFLLLQETWWNANEFVRQFKADFERTECISANTMDLTDINRGRAHGGVSICYRSNVKCKTETIPTSSKSICAKIITIEDMRLLLINVYMPCTNNIDSLEEYSNILREISSICIKSLTSMIVIGGDWNADPGRNDGRTKLFKEFIEHENLCNGLDLDIADVPYTFNTVNKIGNIVTSTIDHFLISPTMKGLVREYKADFNVDNQSDHIPLILKLNMDISYLKTYKKEFKPSVAWHKCDIIHTDNYKNDLDRCLLMINPKNEAISCKNYGCIIHKEDIQKLHNDVIRYMGESSKKCFPHTSQRNSKKDRKIVPGWNEHVKEHAEIAKYWNEIWIQQGKPKDGDLAKMRRKTKLKYHYAVRYVMKENINIRNEIMGEAIAKNDDRKLYDEVRKMTKSSNELPSMMDGQTDIEEIAEIFSNKYEALYNAVSYNNHDMNEIHKDIESRIANGCPNSSIQSNHAHSITVKEVKDAAMQLKLGKKEENGLYSNHFKYGSERLFIILTLLFNSMLSHGIAPDELLLGTMIPLIKDERLSK